METKEHESNWAQACRAFGFDWPGIMLKNDDALAINGSGQTDEYGSPTSPVPGSIAGFWSGQTSGKET